MARSDPTFDPQELLAQLPFVRGLALELLRESAAADDVAQEAAAAALASARTNAPLRGTLRPWLVGVTRNLARMFRRGEQRREARERVAAVNEALPSAVDENARYEALRRVVLAMERLDAGDRTLLVRRFYDDWPPRRIAAELRVPVNTVRTRLARALERLRRELIDGGGRDGAANYPALLLALVAPPPSLSPTAPWIAASAPVATGVLLMTAKMKLAVAVAVVALAAAGVAWWAGEGRRDAPVANASPMKSRTAKESDAKSEAAATRVEAPQSDARRSTPVATSGHRIVALRGRLLAEPAQLERWSTKLTVTASVECGKDGRILARPASDRISSRVAVARDGSFSSEVELDDQLPRVSRLTLAAADPAFAPFHRWFQVPNGSKGRLEWNLEVRAFPAAPVRGRIVDDVGRPVADGAVGVFAIAGGIATLLGEASVDAEGEFGLGVTPPGPCFVVASQRRVGPELGGIDATMPAGPRLIPAIAEATTDETHETDVGDLVLRPGVSIRGRVEWFAHGPVAGAIVDARPAREATGAFTNAPLTRPIWLPSGLSTNVATVTDERGEFELSGLVAGPMRVSVVSVPDGMLSVNPEERQHMDVVAPANDVVLRVDGALVEFEISSRGKPIEGAIVFTGSPSGFRRATRNGRMTTGPDGLVGSLVTAATAGDYSADASGFRGTRGAFTSPAAGERTLIEVELEPYQPTPALALHLVDEQGVPLTVAGVCLDPKSDAEKKEKTAYPTYLTDALTVDGRVIVNDVLPGRYSMSVRPGGSWRAGDGCFAEITRDVTIRAGTVETIELVAVAAGRLRAAARDSHGHFLAARFSLHDEAGQEINAMPIELKEDANGDVIMTSMHSDALATSDFTRIDPPLPPGRYVATFTLAGFESKSVPIEIKPLQPTDVEVVLAPAR